LLIYHSICGVGKRHEARLLFFFFFFFLFFFILLLVVKEKKKPTTPDEKWLGENKNKQKQTDTRKFWSKDFFFCDKNVGTKLQLPRKKGGFKQMTLYIN